MKNRNAINYSTAPISDNEAMEYINYRAAYNYPKAYVKRVEKGTHDIELASGVFIRFIIPNLHETTDLSLDNYHTKLLHSESPDERLIGIVSVIYWGYFSFGDNYARNKVDWLISGNRSQPPTTSAIAFTHTTAALNSLEQLQIGDAIASLYGVSQLNRTPFASKIIAFMAPSIAGVYDNRISDGLSRNAWATHLSKGIGPTKSRQIRNSYQSWCIYLTQIASQINLGISLGKEWEWSCGNDQRQLWRAIDVERAMFAMFASALTS
jgi:hypothetical protein